MEVVPYRVSDSVDRCIDMEELGGPDGGDLGDGHRSRLPLEDGEDDLTLFPLRCVGGDVEEGVGTSEDGNHLRCGGDGDDGCFNGRVHDW